MSNLSDHRVSTPQCRNRPQFCISHTSIYSIDLKFQYNTSFGELNQCAKFQKVTRSRTLSSTLHVPSKRCITTHLCKNQPQFCISHTSIYSIDLKFQYNTSFGELNQCAKFQKVTRSRTLSSTLHVPSKRSVTTHLCKNRQQFCISRTSVYSINLKFQYNTSFGELNQCAKFQKVTRCRSLSSTLHVYFQKALFLQSCAKMFGKCTFSRVSQLYVN